MARRIIRYSAALVLLIYGFAKINGSQFTILDSELDKPMGQVSGFWLTWYYFGFSAFYGTLLASVQITGAVLLTFDRTTTLAAFILAPMLANIILIDIFYSIDPGATLVAIALLAALVGLVAPYRREIIRLIWPPKTTAAESRARTTARWGVRASLIGAASCFTYWIANFNNRVPTPVDGVWDVVRVEPRQLDGAVPRTIFSEYNRAFMAVFKMSGGSYETHHFELDRQCRRIQIWNTWLSKGSEIFRGTYTLASPELTLNGTWQDVDGAALQLHRRDVR